MAASTVGLIYSRATGRLRSVVVPDTDEQINNYVPNPGEAVLIIAAAQYQTAGAGIAGLQSLVNAQTGLSPATADRGAMVDATGFVQSMHFVDAACGDVAFPGLTLELHPTAQVGWFRLAAGSYLNPFARIYRRTARAKDRRVQAIFQ
jgi:hypothetical protein